MLFWMRAFVHILYGAYDRHLLQYKNLNNKVYWAHVGLEVGFIYAYKAGWPVSTASIVQSAFLAVALAFVGLFLYKEALTWNKVLGIAICLVGLYFINR